MPQNVPTIGRRVWYKPLPHEKSFDHNQPFDAGIVHVCNDNCVNLSVLNEQGYPLTGKSSVRLVATWAEAQPGEASWMDYHNAPKGEVSATEQVKPSDSAATT